MFRNIDYQSGKYVTRPQAPSLYPLTISSIITDRHGLQHASTNVITAHSRFNV